MALSGAIVLITELDNPFQAWFVFRLALCAGRSSKSRSECAAKNEHASCNRRSEIYTLKPSGVLAQLAERLNGIDAGMIFSNYLNLLSHAQR